MTLNTVLKICAVGIPLIAALIIWRWKTLSPHRQRQSVAFSLGLTGLAALALFLVNQQYVCIRAPGQQNCLFDVFATVSLFLLCVIFARSALTLERPDLRGDYILRLMLTGAWAGVGVAENLFELIVFLYLLMYVGHRWLKRNGIRWGLFVVWPSQDDGRK